MQTQNKVTQAAMTPAEALTMLKEGNARFVANRRANRDLPQQVQLTGDGQYPFAIVLGCVDSRVSPELIFDQGIGDIFSARIAGNFINEDIL
ncbi:MAG: carbonic anhydrase, partial [Anaerolineae bacterium]|nr:carbonic anhydrase [Anaerolineae bacterium]